MKEIMNNISPEDYLSLLPAPSRALVSKMDKTEQNLVLFGRYLSEEPSSGMAAKGGVIWPKDLFGQIVKEVHIFICTNDARYEEYRKKLKEQGSPVAKTVVIIVSNAVAATIGLASGLLVPLVAVVMAIVAKITVEAWCVKVSQELSPALVVTAEPVEEKPSDAVEE